jgi:nitrogen fixation protein NifX
MESQISNEAALRISMASKSLPDVDTKSFVGLLLQHLGEPLSEQKLLSISPKSFRILMASIDEKINRQSITQALAVLTSKELTLQPLPTVAVGDTLPGPKLRIAVTSNQGELLDGHFGSCLRVLIYEVNAIGSQLVDIRELDSQTKGEKRTDKLITLIQDCHIVFTLSIGGPAAAKVTRANIHPVKKPGAMEAELVLNDLNQVIAGTPPPWIDKLLIR